MSQAIRGAKVYCPLCNDYCSFIGATNASRIANVNRATVYRYVEEGLVHALKVAGRTLRICTGCLLKDYLSQ